MLKIISREIYDFNTLTIIFRIRNTATSKEFFLARLPFQFYQLSN
jgi:hypothetical protein